MSPRLLDLFCGAGGAAVGYHRAGFDEIVGVDIKPQPRYPFEFVQADALEFPLEGFDAIHASPPCQAFTDLKVMWNARRHADLLTPTRLRLSASGIPFVIENVQGAPMPSAARLCGTAFELGIKNPPRQLRRHRNFESNFLLFGTTCRHSGPTIGIYGDHARDRRRREATGEQGLDFPDSDKVRLAQEALGTPWIDSWPELSQAIPPAYTEFIGEQLLRALQVAA